MVSEAYHCLLLNTATIGQQKELRINQQTHIFTSTGQIQINETHFFLLNIIKYFI